MQNLENETNAKISPFTKNEGLQYLMQLGLTRLQANVYINLLLCGKAEARIIAYWANAPRTEVYRSLNELQENGLVDRELGSPLKFTAVAPSGGLQAFIDHKLNEINQKQIILEKFSLEFNNNKEKTQEREYKITSIEGKRRIIAKIKQQHDAARSSVDVVSYLPRFLHIANQCMENYKKAIERGVKYRIILGMPNDSQDLPFEIRKAHDNENTTVKKNVGCLRVNSVIFDKKTNKLQLLPP